MCDKRNKFCYICGLFTDISHIRDFKNNSTVVEVYNKSFNRCYRFSRWYEPETICEYCCATLKKCKFQTPASLPFSTPMTWHYQLFHKQEDCYFCQTNTTGHSFKTRKNIKYANTLTVTKPIYINKNEVLTTCTTAVKEDEEEYIPPSFVATDLHLVSNADFSDLLRDLHLSNRQAEMLGSRLKQWNLVETDFRVTSCRKKDRTLSFEECFKTDDNDSNIVYCIDVPKLFLALNHRYKAEEWRLFVDGSCKSLKAVLLHNENTLPSVPIAYATDTRETYEVMKKIFLLIDYAKHKWKVIADLKVLTILFGMQGGYTKHPCYLCEWDSRAPNRYECKVWPSRESHQIGKKNILNVPLVKSEDVILPPLHLKLGYMKQFVKKLDVNGEAFNYLKAVFPNLSEAKLKGGIFIGPQIRKIMRDKDFEKKLNFVEKRAWNSFIDLCDNFLGNYRSENYVAVVDEFLSAYGAMGCNMSIKVHFLHSHLDFFPQNLGQFSDEQGEHFHQEMSLIEKRFEGGNKLKMISEYCWSLKRDTEDAQLKRKRPRKHF